MNRLTNKIVSIITAITGFISSIFGLVTEVFSGVVSVFWVSGSGADAGPTVLLEALALGAAATLVGVGIYVIAPWPQPAESVL